ncbi:MAG TPA: hypothetical protein VHO06_21290 [Polyangia bacterium]|nr:hypothetical protein [Polyangia bacterium]
MSACIIPVAPEFQDPPDQPQSVPYIANSMPVEGASVVVGSQGADFNVQVTDSQAGVKLYDRWAIDYPPYSSITRTGGPVAQIAPPANGGSINSALPPFHLDCGINPAPNSNSTHQLTLIVADSPIMDLVLADPNHALDTLADPVDGHVVHAFWTVVMPCQASSGASP